VFFAIFIKKFANNILRTYGWLKGVLFTILSKLLKTLTGLVALGIICLVGVRDMKALLKSLTGRVLRLARHIS
jgi:hypothetical protein